MARDFNKTINIEVDIDSANKNLNKLETNVSKLEANVDKLSSSFDKVRFNEKSISLPMDKLAVPFKALEKSIEKAKETNEGFSDQLVEAAVRTTQAFVTTTGTILSFTSSEEDAAKITAKLGQAMAIADSIEQVYNATKAITALKEKISTAAKVADVVATEAVTVSTTAATGATYGLGAAFKFLTGPIGLILGALAAVSAAYYYFIGASKSASEQIDDEIKSFEAYKKSLVDTAALEKARSDKKISQIKDQALAQKTQNADDLKAAQKNVADQLIIQDVIKKNELRIRTEGNDAQRELLEQAIQENKIALLEAQTEVNKINKTISDTTADQNLKTLNDVLDNEITKLNAIGDYASKRQVIEKEREKQLNEINNRIIKGEAVSANERFNIQKEFDDKLSTLNNEILDDKNKKQQESFDKELANLAEVEQTTARFQEFQIQSNKELAELKLKFLKEEITFEEYKNEQIKVRNKLETNTLNLVKQINEETKSINQQTKDLSIQKLIDQLNKTSKDINQDLLNQTTAINLQRKANIEKITAELEAAKDKLGKITAESSDEQKAAYDENLKALEANAKLRIEIENKVAEESIKASEKVAKERKLEPILKAIDDISEGLNKLSEIKVFSDNNGINNFSNVIGGLQKGLAATQDIFKSYQKGQKITFEQVAKLAGELVNIASSVAQAAFQANIDSFEKQLEYIQEKKDLIEADIETSLSRIDELQNNLVESNVEDRNRIIRLIERERQKEKELQKQKQQAARDELKIQEKIKEEKRKAFEAQKAAAISQVIISTSLAVMQAVAQLGPVAGAFAGVAIGLLGAAQIGIIASQPTPEFKKGGFTEKDSSNDKAVGVVHANEWVAPAWMVENPKFKNHFIELDNIRQNGPGFKAGGFSSGTLEDTNMLQETLNVVKDIALRPVIAKISEINSVNEERADIIKQSTL